jgi:peptide deformylase
VAFLNFPAERMRAAYARVEGVDVRGRPITVEGTGELARCLQHETDHLRGELYIDALTGESRRAVLRQLREAGGLGRRPL